MRLPRKVSQMVSCGALIVGGAAEAIISDDDVAFNKLKDFDVMAPDLETWYQISLLIPSNAKVNSYGGWKFKIDNIEVDVWVESLQHYLHHGKMDFGGYVYAIDFLNNRAYTSVPMD